MTQLRARLYLAIACVGLVPLLAATYFFGVAILEMVGDRAEIFRIVLYLFIVSIACTELRIYIGGRSPRNVFLLVHVVSAIILSVFLILVAFFYDAAWLTPFLYILFGVVLLSGIPVWYEGVKKRALLLGTLDEAEFLRPR